MQGNTRFVRLSLRMEGLTSGVERAPRKAAPLGNGAARQTGLATTAPGMDNGADCCPRRPTRPAGRWSRAGGLGRSRLSAHAARDGCYRSRLWGGAGVGVRVMGVVAVVLAAVLSGRAHALVLAEGGRSDYDILVSRDRASPSELFAAKELSHFLREITGAVIPVCFEDESRASKHIFVGDSRALRKVLPNLNLAPLGREGYAIKTVGEHLVLAGGRLRGSMYAVYSFLEEHLGCRWFTSRVSYVPRRNRLEVGRIDERYLPPLEYREDFYAEAFDGIWAARNRMNGNSHRLTPEQGDKVRYIGFVHTFYSLVPPSKYFKEHPEYFALVGGERRSRRAQLCLTNPDVVRIAIEAVRQRLREARARGLPEDVIVSVSQNDCWGWCECPRCSALADHEGSQSGPIIHFVNQIADAIRDEFPHAAIDTLAYSYSRKPPRYVRPRPNVIVRLCSIECCFSHPLATCPVNASFMDDLRGWSRICKRLYVWDYVTNFAHYIMPFPNFRVLAPNIRTFVAHNVRGIFEEGNYHGGGEFCHLRAYVLAKLLWNPQYDAEKAVDEFLRAYYGPAAPHIRRYIDLMHDTVEARQIHVHIYSPPTQAHLNPEVLEKANALFDAAETAVADRPELLLRVRHARMPLMYVAIRTFNPRYRIVDDRFVPTDVEPYRRALDQFASLARKLRIPRIREGQGMEDWLRSVPRDFPTLSVVRLRSKDLEATIIPELGGRLFSLLDRCLYREFMYAPPRDSREYPGEGGYVDFVGERWPGKEAVRPWRVVYRDPYKVVLEHRSDGLVLRRTLRLNTRAPQVEITVEVSNTSSGPREVIVRLHPSFRLGVVDDCVVEFTATSGSGKSIPLAEIEATEPNIFLRGPDMPAGKWVAANLKYGYAIEATFDPTSVGQCLLNFNRAEHRVNLELYSRKQVLKPGGTMQVTYTWRIIRNLASYRHGRGPKGFGRWGL